jgi:hypothetical protein
MRRLTRTLPALVLFLALCGPIAAHVSHGHSHQTDRTVADPFSRGQQIPTARQPRMHEELVTLTAVLPLTEGERSTLTAEN